MRFLSGWPYAVGYLYSLWIGHELIKRLSRALWAGVSSEYPVEAEARQRYEYLVMMVGYIERALYTACWLLGRPEFIAVWLAFKISGQWKSWSEDRTGRISLNVFLIGNGFSLAYGVIGAAFVGWIAAKKMVEAFGIPLILVLAHLLFLRSARRAAPKAS